MTKVYDNATDLITFARLQSQNTTSGSSYLGSDGLLKFAAEDEPRIEYGSDGSLKGLLIEEQRANLLAHSEDFTHSSWSKNNGSITAGATTAPSGGLADQYVEDTSNSYHRVATPMSVTSGVTYTLSVLAKYSGRQYLVMNANTLFNARSFFDIQAGTVASTLAGTATIDDMGNGWFRCSITATATSSHTTQAYIGTNTSAADSAYLGDGTSGVYLYGAQLEEGSFPTSYIPTSGSQSTRSPDIASIPVSAFGYNQEAGTVVVEVDSMKAGVSQRLLSIYDPADPNNNRTDLLKNGNHFLQHFTNDGGVNQTNHAVSVLGLTSLKVAATIALDDYSMCVNGGTVVAETDGTPTVPRVDTFRLGGGLSSPLNGHIKSLKYFPRRLTDAQLQELTS